MPGTTLCTPFPTAAATTITTTTTVEIFKYNTAGSRLRHHTSTLITIKCMALSVQGIHSGLLPLFAADCRDRLIASTEGNKRAHEMRTLTAEADRY